MSMLLLPAVDDAKGNIEHVTCTPLGARQNLRRLRLGTLSTAPASATTEEKSPTKHKE